MSLSIEQRNQIERQMREYTEGGGRHEAKPRSNPLSLPPSLSFPLLTHAISNKLCRAR